MCECRKPGVISIGELMKDLERLRIGGFEVEIHSSEYIVATAKNGSYFVMGQWCGLFPEVYNGRTFDLRSEDDYRLLQVYIEL